MSVGDEDEDVDVEAAESDKASVGEHTPLQKITDTEEDRTSDRYYNTLLDTQCFIGTACILCRAGSMHLSGVCPIATAEEQL